MAPTFAEQARQTRTFYLRSTQRLGKNISATFQVSRTLSQILFWFVFFRIGCSSWSPSLPKSPTNTTFTFNQTTTHPFTCLAHVLSFSLPFFYCQKPPNCWSTHRCFNTSSSRCFHQAFRRSSRNRVGGLRQSKIAAGNNYPAQTQETTNPLITD